MTKFDLVIPCWLENGGKQVPKNEVDMRQCGYHVSVSVAMSSRGNDMTGNMDLKYGGCQC